MKSNKKKKKLHKTQTQSIKKIQGNVFLFVRRKTLKSLIAIAFLHYSCRCPPLSLSSTHIHTQTYIYIHTHMYILCLSVCFCSILQTVTKTHTHKFFLSSFSSLYLSLYPFYPFSMNIEHTQKFINIPSNTFTHSLFQIHT